MGAKRSGARAPARILVREEAAKRRGKFLSGAGFMARRASSRSHGMRREQGARNAIREMNGSLWAECSGCEAKHGEKPFVRFQEWIEVFLFGPFDEAMTPKGFRRYGPRLFQCRHADWPRRFASTARRRYSRLRTFRAVYRGKKLTYLSLAANSPLRFRALA